MMTIKISSIQKRLNRKLESGNSVRGLIRSISFVKPRNVCRADKPEEKHIVWMSRTSALDYDTTGYAVISIGDPDRVDFSHFGSSPTLYLNFNPSFAKTNCINSKHRDEIKEFLEKHDSLNIMVHCEYGSQRSAGLAIGMFEAYKSLNPEDHPSLYKYANGVWQCKSNLSNDDYNHDRRCESVGYDAVRQIKKE